MRADLQSAAFNHSATPPFKLLKTTILKIDNCLQLVTYNKFNITKYFNKNKLFIFFFRTLICEI